MKKVFAVIVALLLFLNSCSALMDGKVVTRDGKETPFKAEKNLYPAPSDPFSNR